MSTLADLVSGIDAGTIRVVDLTRKLTSDTTPALRLPDPWPDLIDFHIDEVSRYNEPGPMWRHNNIHTGEHIGTHIDVPVHWISGKDGDDVSELPVERLVGPACVIDLSAECAEDPDFVLEIEHITAWEQEHGPIPPGAWLLFRSGWDQYGDDEKTFLNADENGSHTPGISVECSRYLAEKTPIAGFGVETVGIDAGNAATFDPPFPAHYFLLGADKYGLTFLQNLADLPPTGAVIVVSPMPIVGGTGSPTRVFAIVEEAA